MNQKKTLASAAQLAESCSSYLMQTFQNLRPADLCGGAVDSTGLDPSRAKAVISRLGEIHRLAGEVLQILDARSQA